MFEKFLSKFKLDNSQSISGTIESFKSNNQVVSDFINAYGNQSFNKGIYTVHSPEDIKYWNGIVAETFPQYSENIECFSHDWLGRQFALHIDKILLFEAGTGEVLEIPCTIQGFINEELVQYSDAALAENFFQEWLSINEYGLENSVNNCVGYKVPLFLGGNDIISNLEKTDIKVYWHLMSQLILKAKLLPEGSKIGNVVIK